MLPLIIGGLALVSLVAIIGSPSNENETVREVKLRLERQEQRAAEERENEGRAKILDEVRRSIETEHAKYKPALELRRSRAEMKGKKNKEKEGGGRRKQEEEEGWKKLAEEKQDLAGRVRRLEEREKEQKEAIEKRKREQAAQLEAEERFGGPLRWPTREEFQETLNKIQYDSSRFHFAIVGKAGSGKSSLVNAFRNLGNKDDGAAPTGTKETTLKTTRYPDPGTEHPRKLIVWFDVPGAGTQRIPHKDYFVKQGLYVFDLIILAISDRLEEIDVRIIEDCARFKVPAFIVRSKADMHILNTIKEHNGDCAQITADPRAALYQTCREKFVKESQETVSEELARQNLQDQHVYVVSRDVLRRTYKSALHPYQRLPDWGREPEAIHESELVKMILTAAGKRRCKTDGLSVVQNALSLVGDSVGRFISRHHNVDDEVAHTGAPSDLTDFLDVSGQAGESQARARAGAESDQAITQKPTTPALLEEPRRRVLKVIYPREPTDGNELFNEMLRNDSELDNMLAEKPRMFTPKVALLTFYPLAPIPCEIRAFGGVLHLEDYKEKRGQGGRGRGGGAIQGRGGQGHSSRTGSSEGEGNNSNRTVDMSNRGGRLRQGRGRYRHVVETADITYAVE